MQLRTLYTTIYSVELWGLFFTLYDERCPFLVEAEKITGQKVHQLPTGSLSLYEHCIIQ